MCYSERAVADSRQDSIRQVGGGAGKQHVTPLNVELVNNHNLHKVQAHRGGRAVKRRGSAAARLLILRVRIPPRAWIYNHCDCLSGSGHCDRLITRPEES